ncbi:MAG: hypothetical protein NT033_02940, partial [Candidatus Omnitrophica bacterium]|nr:hypothetical protein [Candidatus Omnitrophota bacterium]
MEHNTIMGKSELIDKLNRAYQMEGEMDSELVNLCQMESLPKELSEESRKRIHSILSSIRSDTL